MRLNGNMGKRHWSDHWQIRAAWAVACLLLVATSWTFYKSIVHLHAPRSPHYTEATCFACHEARGSKLTAKECFECHDPLTRELLPGAVEKRLAVSKDKPCIHPIQMLDGKPRSVTELCLSCHTTSGATVAFMNFNLKSFIEIDMAMTHPVGLMPTDTVYPRTLPLSKKNQAINCITCHDPHGQDRRFHLLRYYYPGNGRPADFRPLCQDCHHDPGWLPLKLGHDTVIQPGKGLVREEH